MRNTKQPTLSLLNEVGEQPKSDYTYSASITYRQRVTPDRMIGSPNMSRRTLKGGNINYIRTSEFTSSDDSNAWDLRSRTVLKPMDAISDTSDEETGEQQLQQRRSRRSTRSRSLDVPNSNGSLTRTITTTSTEYTTMKMLHGGLDTESDGDDGTDSAVPIRATPLLARGGTPLGRATTPLKTLKLASSRRSSSAAMDSGKGYTIGEATIAEEEEENRENIMMQWSKKTIHTLTRITTIVTASIAMMAARSVAAASSRQRTVVDRQSSTSTSTSTFALVKAKYKSVCERLAKNPILIWIPLLIILLLLALAAYWCCLPFHGKTTGDSSDPTENDGPPLLFAFMPTLNLRSRVYSGASSLSAALSGVTANISWLMSSCYAGLVTVFTWLQTSTSSCLIWLWSMVVYCFAFLSQLPYLLQGYVRYCALGVYSVFSSYGYYFYGFLSFVSSDPESNETNHEKESFTFIAWLSNLSPLECVSEAYVAITEGMQYSGTMLWNAWLLFVLSMGEICLAMVSYTLWALSSIWAAIFYVLTGLWTLVTYLCFALVSILWTAATAVLSLAPNTSSSVIVQTQKKAVLQPTVLNVSYPKIEEIVQQVLENEKLRNIIAAAIAESSEGQLTDDGVAATAKLVVERELSVVKEEMSALKSEMLTNAAVSAVHRGKIVRLQEERADLIRELEKLGQHLYNVEGKIEIAEKRAVDFNQDNDDQIEQLVQQINKLEVNHKHLAADVKSCCDDKKLPAILGEIFGLKSNGTADEEQPDIGAWLKNYFVAKDELAVKLNELMASMQVKPDDDAAQATLSQTTQFVMAAVLTKLQEEMHKQQLQLSQETQQSISAQVNSQVTAAAGILEEQVQLQNQQLQENLRENVNQGVQEQVTSAVKIAVDIAVNTAMPHAVKIAVSEAVDIAVNTAVPQAVEKCVPRTVKDILPNMVSGEIAISLPGAVASAVPVAVTSAVSEAMVHISENQSNDQTSQNKVKNEIVGVTGSASANISHGGGDGSLFIPGMHLFSGLNETEVMKIVQDALRKYDADKTGMVDHALESAGGNVISTRCTESFEVYQAEVIIFGFPIYRYSTNTPRTVIQPNTMPGQCWAFKGSQGYIVIQLAGNVRPTGFTLEHIPKSLSPNGVIDSAPRMFEVWGLLSEKDEGLLLGTFEYVEDGDPLQYFPVTVENSGFPLVELKINSNHGNLQYTCLYRFRVHGLRLL